MGIARGAIALLLEEASRRPFAGKVATLGKQAIYTNPTELAGLYRRFGLTPKGQIPQTVSAIDDQTVLKLMGFDAVHSFDYSDYEGATHIIDLNADTLPDKVDGGYDVVLDSGTIEHVFHVPNALKNIFHLAKVGGRIIFLSPASNHMDHGFYMFSPTFFFDYYAANGFIIETMYVVRYDQSLDGPWDIYEYQPGAWQDLAMGGLDDKPYAIFVVATKTPHSTCNAVPQQGYYANQSQHYAGSRLARGQSASGRAAAAAQPDATPNVPAAPAPAPVAPSGLRVLARRIPGARALYRQIQNAKRILRGTAQGELTSGRRPLGKKLHARF
jgi:hypothetical protein